MKSFLIIGLGEFGAHLCRNLTQYDVDTMVIDTDEERVNELLPYATNAKIGDCTNVEVLKSLGIKNFDMCFVCIGDDFQSSLEITSLLSELEAKYIVSLAEHEVQAKFLKRNGANRVIYPNEDMAIRAARTFSRDSIFDYFSIDEKYAMFEITPFKEIIGKTVKDVNFRSHYKANIVGYKRDGKMHMMVDPEYVFKTDEHIIVVGESEKLGKLLKD